MRLAGCSAHPKGRSSQRTQVDCELDYSLDQLRTHPMRTESYSSKSLAQPPRHKDPSSRPAAFFSSRGFALRNSVLANAPLTL